MYDPENNINFYFQGLRYIELLLMFYIAEALEIEIDIIFRVVYTTYVLKPT